MTEFYFKAPKLTLVERSQLEIEQFLAKLRFENRGKLEELTLIS